MESDVEELMPRLLPVGRCDLADDLDPTAPPRTPQEYLKRVQIEAARCPDVVVAHIDPKKLKRKQTVNVSLSGCQPAPQGYCPSFKWQQQQVAQFSAVRQSLHKHRSHWKTQPLDSNVAMPKPEDEESWKKFCLGEKINPDLAAALSADNENPGIDYLKVGFPPLLSIVSRMSQVCAKFKKRSLAGCDDCVLRNGEGPIPEETKAAFEWLSAGNSNECFRVSDDLIWRESFYSRIVYLHQPLGGRLSGPLVAPSWIQHSASTGRWLYALLACLEKPLLPEAHSLIRQLARRCSEVRATVENKDDERVSALNLVICLVSRYFEQRDLADNEPS